MTIQAGLALPARRIVAALATVAVAALGIITTGPAAHAAEPITVGTPTTTLTDDRDGNGVPSLGDIVTVSVPITAGDKKVTVSSLAYGTGNLPHLTNGLSGVSINAGETATVSTDHPLLVASDFGYLGSGPSFPTVTVAYWIGFSRSSVTVAGPASIYAGPPQALSVVTTHDRSSANPLVEGDTIGYTTTVTNLTPLWLRLDTMPGYDDFAGPVWLKPASATSTDDTLVVHKAARAVTYDDMVAGAVTFPSSSIGWGAGFTALTLAWSGTTPVTYDAAPTAAIDTTVAASVAPVVHTAAGAPVGLGDAVAGDVIDYTFGLTNNGNVTLNFVVLRNAPTWPTADGKAFRETATGLAPGASLPAGPWTAESITSACAGASFAPYVLTASDVAAGYVDLEWVVKAAPNETAFDASPASYTQRISQRVFLKEFSTRAAWNFTKAELNDTNGDGIGQAGETITYRVRFKNRADQNLRVDAAFDGAASDIATPVGAWFPGAVVVPGDVTAAKWTYTITAADEARLSVTAAVEAQYTGLIDGATDSRTASETVVTGPYVAPPSRLDTTMTYVDTNGDGSPSIGEEVTITATVTNMGTYDLTGLAVADAAGSDVTGLLPTFTGTVAAGTAQSQSFTYVLTAADFARGSLTYSTEMTATGLATTASSTSVNLTDITFAAYATDLDGFTSGGIVVCQADGSPTDTVVISSTISVVPGTACLYGGPSAGYRVVAFSSPMLMGTDTFSVKVPGALGVGQHRLALYSPAGVLVGFRDVTVKDPIAFSGPAGGGVLAYTGASRDGVTGMAGGAAALVLLGTAALVAASRRRPDAPLTED